MRLTAGGRVGSRAAATSLVLVVACAFILRLPALAEPIGIDQGIFATVGWGITRGLTIYREVWDQKPPGIHLTYAAAIALAGPHASIIFWLDFAAAVTVCLLVYLIGRALSGASTGRVAALLYATLMLPAAKYGYGGFLERAVPETFILVFVASAAFVLARSSETRTTAALTVAALLIGTAALYKPTAVLYWPAFALWCHFRGPMPLRRFLVATVALVVPAVILIAWLFMRGAAGEAWIAVVEYNRVYVAAGSGPLVLVDRLAHEGWRLIKTDPLWTVGALAVVATALELVRRRPIPSVAVLGLCWLAAAVSAAAANGIRLYSNYFIPAGAPLALLGGWLFIHLRQNQRLRWLALTLVVGVILATAIRGHYFERAWASITADARALRADPQERLEYLLRFGGYRTGRGYSARANAELASYLDAHTTDLDRVYIFGMAPSVYFMAERLPANRFVWTYPGVVNLVHRDAFTPDALAVQLAQRRPVYLILERNNRDSMSGWRIESSFDAEPIQHLLSDYVKEIEIEDFVVYRRRSRAPV